MQIFLTRNQLCKVLTEFWTERATTSLIRMLKQIKIRRISGFWEYGILVGDLLIRQTWIPTAV